MAHAPQPNTSRSYSADAETRQTTGGMALRRQSRFASRFRIPPEAEGVRRRPLHASAVADGLWLVAAAEAEHPIHGLRWSQAPGRLLRRLVSTVAPPVPEASG
jgi:hypothetical protein